MMYPKIPLAQTVIQLCKAKNIQHIVLSPGSRNAPLTIGFTHDPFFKCYSIVDERCAAFFALGIAQQIQHPVAVVCTSGSALLNYYPAVAEAYYSDIPLVVLSADRPKYLVGIGDGQTINQKEVYKNHSLYSANLKLDLKDEYEVPEDEELPIIKNLEDKFERFLGIKKELQKENEHEINLALNQAIVNKGPVHINIPFDEPLYDTVEQLTVNPENIEVKVKSKKMDDYVAQDILEEWNNAKKKMVLVGVNFPDSLDQNWMEELAKDDSVIVFTETTSNLHHNQFFPSIDQLISPLTDEELEALAPDLLLTFGGMIVSKRIKKFLRKFQPKQHWHIDVKKANDTFFSLEKHITQTPNQFFSFLFPNLTHTVKSDYKLKWNAIKTLRNVKHKAYLKTIPFSDFKVFDSILKHLPEQSQLQIGNSSAIRYQQLFNNKPTVKVFCNRGTSGIDGSTSTAIGASVASNLQTTFITGDLSFFYDSNALWNNYIPNNFRIIVINNNGGGIFRILPGHKNTENFDTYFETKHNLKAKQLCDMYGFEYTTAENEDTLHYQLHTFYNPSSKPKLLEIVTPSQSNDEILLEYFNFIK
ncbi:2-succinyl-5-enolpyruvyl-6-hydroxy-3-cyclohexene-1-carboxylate synthase [Lacinutrix salivirga]